MGIVTAFIDALAGFVRRNPLTVLLIVVLAVGTPALLRGIALFILYFIVGLLFLGITLLLLFRWRLHRAQREMERHFGEGFGTQGGFGAQDSGTSPRREARSGAEGEVRVHKTSASPEKRVAEDVGDYVDFEETKDPGR